METNEPYSPVLNSNHKNETKETKVIKKTPSTTMNSHPQINTKKETHHIKPNPHDMNGSFNNNSNKLQSSPHSNLKNNINKKLNHSDQSNPSNNNPNSHKQSQITPSEIYSNNVKCGLELIAGISITYLKKIMSNDTNTYPFQEGTNLHTFYMYAFPYIKLLMVILILSVIYITIKGIIYYFVKRQGMG